MAECQSEYHHSPSLIQDMANDLRLKSSDKDISKKLNEILDYVREQQKKNKSVDSMKIGTSVLDAGSSFAQHFNKPLAAFIDTASKFLNVISTSRELKRPSVVDQKAEVLHNASMIEDKVDQLAQCVHTLKDTVDALHLELSDVSDCLKERKKKEEDKAWQILLDDMGKVLIVTRNSIQKFKSGDPLEITRGVLDITSSVARLVSPYVTPYGPIIGTLCGVISEILTKSEPQQPSVLDQLAKVVHSERVHFNKRLQDQKYDGLKRRVSDQKSQLQTMKPGEKLDDPNLWNDYVQFMGELSNRFESPLPFMYEDNMTKDPDVADFVTAVVTYCEAYCCFMALLTAAKGRFAELGSTFKEDENAVDRKISCQREDANEKLSFLSEEKYLTFLGRLPYEGGKLIKIVVLSRNMRGKSLVEAVRGSLDLPEMQSLAQVEAAAANVARQVVKGKVQGHQVPPADWLTSILYPRRQNRVQFINETNYPMKIVSGRVGRDKSGPVFVQDVKPRASFQSRLGLRFLSFLSGYIIIYLNGILSPSTEPPAGQARVIEFALSFWSEINIQDKTGDEFTRGQDTYNKMKCGEAKTLYWFESGKHFMARGEILPNTLRRFVIQDFDPCSMQDIVTTELRDMSHLV